jgi:hypothetical protein
MQEISKYATVQKYVTVARLSSEFRALLKFTVWKVTTPVDDRGYVLLPEKKNYLP